MKGPRNLSYSPLLKERNKTKLLKCLSSTSAFFCKRNILSSHWDNNFCFKKQEEKYKQCAARTNNRGVLLTTFRNAHTQYLWTKLLQLLIPDIQDCHTIYFRLKIYETLVMIKFQAVSGSPAIRKLSPVFTAEQKPEWWMQYMGKQNSPFYPCRSLSHFPLLGG